MDCTGWAVTLGVGGAPRVGACCAPAGAATASASAATTIAAPRCTRIRASVTADGPWPKRRGRRALRSGARCRPSSDRSRSSSAARSPRCSSSSSAPTRSSSASRSSRRAAQAILGARAAERYDAETARALLPARDRRRAAAGAHAAAPDGGRVARPRRAPPRRPQGGRHPARPGAADEPPALHAAAHGAGRPVAERALVPEGPRHPADHARRDRAARGRLRDRQADLRCRSAARARASRCSSASCSSSPCSASWSSSGEGARRRRGTRRAPSNAGVAVCGRYSLTGPDPSVLRERFPIGERVEVAPALQRRARRPRCSRSRPTARAPRAASVLRWGLVPHWAEDPAKLGLKLINARAETHGREARVPRRVRAPALPDRRRRLLRVGEAPGRHDPARGGSPAPDGEPFAFAGLWATWRGRPDVEPLRTLHDRHDADEPRAAPRSTTACR